MKGIELVDIQCSLRWGIPLTVFGILVVESVHQLLSLIDIGGAIQSHKLIVVMYTHEL